jgi:caffeoyl-CoA O-methyltransferase
MTIYNDQLSQYTTELFAAEDEALRRAREDNAGFGLPAINIKPEEGRFLQILALASGAVKALEIGTLGGYSGIWIARGLPPGGKLITLEKEPRHAEVAQRHFDLAGLNGKVEIRIGDAHQSLLRLAGEGPFDFVFIDAEKTGYDAYLDWALENVRLGGVIAAHNAYRKGSVAGAAPPDDYTAVTQAFNRRVAGEPRLLSTIFPAGDGALIAVKVA